MGSFSEGVFGVWIYVPNSIFCALPRLSSPAQRNLSLNSALLNSLFASMKGLQSVLMSACRTAVPAKITATVLLLRLLSAGRSSRRGDILCLLPREAQDTHQHLIPSPAVSDAPGHWVLTVSALPSVTPHHITSHLITARLLRLRGFGHGPGGGSWCHQTTFSGARPGPFPGHG